MSYRKRYGADGTDGTDPFNRIVNEPKDNSKRRPCEYCKKSSTYGDLVKSSENTVPEELAIKFGINGYICVRCKRLGPSLSVRKIKLEKEQKEFEEKQKLVRYKQEQIRKRTKIENAKRKGEVDVLYYYHTKGESGLKTEIMKLLASSNNDLFITNLKLVQGIGMFTHSKLDFDIILTRLFTDCVQNISSFDSLIFELRNSKFMRLSLKSLSIKQYENFLEQLEIGHWDEENKLQFLQILLVHPGVNSDNLSIINGVRKVFPIKKDYFISYIIRKNNRSDKNLEHINSMISLIRDEEQRLLSILSLPPQTIGKYIAESDVFSILESPFYLMMISVAQLQGIFHDENFEHLLEKIEEKERFYSISPGKYCNTILQKLNKITNNELQNSNTYFTLENFFPIYWNLDGKLKLISGRQKGMQLDANEVYDNVRVINTIQMNFDDKFLNKSYKSLWGKKDPFCIARLITDFNCRYSTSIREKLDRLLISYE